MSMWDACNAFAYPPQDGGEYPLLTVLVDELNAHQIWDVKSYLVAACTDRTKLQKHLRLSEEQLHRLTHEVSVLALSSGLSSCRDLCTGQYLPSSGCESLDSFLGGGLKPGQITEVCGEASAGKTQFCLQFALYATLPAGHRKGPEGCALYIVTEDFPHRRLHTMATHLCRQYGVGKADLDTAGVTREPPLQLLDRLFICKVGDTDGLWTTLLNVPQLIEEASRPIQVLVIDSIAALFRGDFTEGAAAKAEFLFKCAALLSRIASQYNIAVLIANQVGCGMRSDFWAAATTPPIPTPPPAWAKVQTGHPTRRQALHTQLWTTYHS